MNGKIRIGIAMPGLDEARVNSMRNYIWAVENAGAEAVQLPPVKNSAEAARNLRGVNALIEPGGGDIAPELYQEETLPECGPVDDARDTSDIAYFDEAYRMKMPVFAICRGFQLVNVRLGGTLYQDIPSQIGTVISHSDPAWKESRHHELVIDDASSYVYRAFEGSRGTVNSSHHQCVKAAAPGLKVTARAADGIIEAYESRENDSVIMGTQFHPEKEAREGDIPSLKLFEMFLKLTKDQTGERYGSEDK